LTLVLLMLFIAVNGPKIYRWFSNYMASLQKAKKQKKSVEPITMANPNTESPKMRRPTVNLNNHNNNNNHHNNRLNRTSSIFTVTGTEFDNDQKTVSTPISTRYPAEDTLTSSVTAGAADYTYDNKALQLTPVGEEKPKIETNF